MKAVLIPQVLFALLPWLALGMATGCSEQAKKPEITPGVTTAETLIAKLGQPKNTWAPEQRPQAKLLEYPDGCSFQTEEKLVVGVTCPPQGRESTLQYWRHKWVGDHQKFEPLPASKNSHGQRLYQLASRERHMAVVYDESVDRVIRVVRYGQ